MRQGHPVKLRDGSWGARIVFAGQVPVTGDLIIVATKSGKSWEAEVDAIVSLSPAVFACLNEYDGPEEITMGQAVVRTVPIDQRDYGGADPGGKGTLGRRPYDLGSGPEDPGDWFDI